MTLETIYGMVTAYPSYDNTNLKPWCNPFAQITVRYTEDKTGKTLSLQYSDIQISVPFEEIERIMRKEKSDEKTT